MNIGGSSPFTLERVSTGRQFLWRGGAAFGIHDILELQIQRETNSVKDRAGSDSIFVVLVDIYSDK